MAGLARLHQVEQLAQDQWWAQDPLSVLALLLVQAQWWVQGQWWHLVGPDRTPENQVAREARHQAA